MKSNHLLILLSSILLSSSLYSCSCSNNNSSGNISSIEDSSSISSIEEDPKEDLLVILTEMSKQYGDSILIKYKDFEILVDAGQYEDANKVANTLSTYVTDHVLDMVIATHPHADHIGGLSSYTLNKGGISSINTWIDSGALYDTSTYRSYENLRTSFVNKGTTYYAAYELFHNENLSRTFYLNKEDNVYIDIFNNPEYVEPQTYYKGGEINNVSVAFGLNHYKTQFYFAGDLEQYAEQPMMMNEDKEYFKKDNYVVYKASHHGSTGANTYTILNWVKADMYLISAAITEENRTSKGVLTKQHPHNGTILRFKIFTDEIYWNGVNGRLICTSNGLTCKTVGEGRTINYYFEGAIVSPSEEKNAKFLDTKWYKSGK